MSYQRVVLTGWGGPDKLQVITEETLPTPGPGQVRVRVLARTVSFSDLQIRQGNYPGLGVKPPFSPGYDLLGEVDALGPGVTGLRVGQRVAALTITGSYTEVAIWAAADLVPVPDGLDPAEAVSLVLGYVTAYQMLHRVAQVRPGAPVLVHGAGGAVGSALVQLAALHGVTVYGTASAAHHDLLTSLGAIPIDYRREDFVARVRDLTGGRGVEAVFDAISLSNFKRSWQTLARGGVFVGYGFTAKGRGGSDSVPVMWGWVMLKHVLPNGRAGRFYSIGARDKAEFRYDLTTLLGLLAERRIAPVIAERLPLTEAARAHERLMAGGVAGRLVLVS